ncbi:MAG: endopeptidase La [Alphaproteobacteria bacterium]|nr:endopeptidase La [Alphaproteobacteria bacterium]
MPMTSLTLPVLPLRDIVVFPHMVVPLFVGREKSVVALEQVLNEEKQILLLTQRDHSQDEPASEDLYDVGTVASILQLLKLPDGTVKVLVEGQQRAKVKSFTREDDFFEAEAEALDNQTTDEAEALALMRAIHEQFDQYAKLNKKMSQELIEKLREVEDPEQLVDMMGGHLSAKIDVKQEILETLSLNERLEKVLGHMEGEISVLQVEKRIRNRVKRQMEKTQREYYLNEQMKAIQRELGEGDDGRSDIDELEERINKTKLSKEAREKAQAELKKLKMMSPMSAEATVVRNYLDWLIGIPWGKKSRKKIAIQKAESILDDGHYGLEKVKERIVEFLAVQKRTGGAKGPILCLVGPPGVGKTSLGKAMAEATGREFIRVSLGGVRDEAEIRGHRRTYIGSMPGKIIQSMKKAKTSNPLFLLDEIDKMGQDFRGDPGSALLEVLDPEQNSTFADHYLEVDYDLSQVMFITTANSLNMPGPLLDRMEIIRIAGYTEEEKLEIAHRHLIPRQLKNHKLNDKEFHLSRDGVVELIRTYTREAGVRNLEREISKICRKAVKKLEAQESSFVKVTKDNLAEFSGVKKFRFGLAEANDLVGVTTGLAWTEVGGDLLAIESVMLPGKGKMTATGKLGDVMKESIEAAASLVRARAPQLGINPKVFETRDIHVHVPEGATPKDGPSAGVAMVTSIVSMLTGIPVRRDVAMTGEITLRGRVLPIGGLKEKLLAAVRGGIKTAIIPKENEKDLDEIPDVVKNTLSIVAVEDISDVIEVALTEPLSAIDWSWELFDQEKAAKSQEKISSQMAH